MKKNGSIILFVLFLFLANQHIDAQNKYELLYLKGNYDQIISESSELTDSSSIVWRAVAYNKKGELLRAIEELEKGLLAFENNTRMESLLAEMYYKSGQTSKAKPLLVKNHKEHDHFLMLVRIMELESDNAGAVSYLEDRLKKDSLNTEYLGRLGDNYNELDMQLNAIKAFEKLISINPMDQVVLGKLANLYLKITKYGIAIELCNSALEIDPENRSIIRIKGLAAFRKSDFEMACECFSELLERGDSSIVTLKHLGISESKIYSFADSREHLLLAFNQDTSDHEICYFLGRAFLNSMQAETGLYYLDLAEKLIQPIPAIEAAIIIEKVSIYESLKQYDKALPGYELAYQISPKPEYLFFMASIYHHRLDERKEALKYYNLYLEDLPPPSKNDQPTLKEQKSVSLKKVAEQNIESLREELFFSGELEK